MRHFTPLIISLLLFINSFVSSSPIHAVTEQAPKPFYGMNYSPFKPNGCLSPEEITNDLNSLAAVTSHVRIYAVSPCQQGQKILQALSQPGPASSLSVVLGIWTSDFDNELAETLRLIQMFGSSKIIGISVGSEVLYLNEISTEDLITKIQTVKTQTAGSGIPIFTSELLQLFTPELVNAVDIIFPTLHPFYAGLDVNDNVVGKTFDWMQGMLAQLGTSGKPVFISEIGWPSSGAQIGAAIPSPDNQQQFTKSFVCTAKSLNIPYFIFEYTDATWKSAAAGSAETSFGLFTDARQPKFDIGSLAQC